MNRSTHPQGRFASPRACLFALAMAATSSLSHAGTGNIDLANKNINLTVLFTYEETDANLNGSSAPSWKDVFNDASSRLWNATNGQLKIGTVTVYRRAVNKKEDANVCILDGVGGAYSNVSGLGQAGRHMTFFESTHRSTSPAYQGGFSMVHEMGHYVFGLFDQYQGSYIPFSKRNNFTLADFLVPIQIQPDFTFSTSKTDPNASIMDGGGVVPVKNARTEFDTVTNATRNVRQIVRRVPLTSVLWMNEQIIRNKESCWETMAKLRVGGAPVFPTVPVGDSPTALPPGSTTVDFKVVPTLSRLVLCIDRSGSMSDENKMELAKLGASILTNLAQERHEFDAPFGKHVIIPGDRIGVVDFDSSVTTTFPVAEVDAAGTVKTRARSAIATLQPRGGTAIGDGAQRSLSLITAQGPVVTQEAIVLLSDGQNNEGINPLTAATNAFFRGAKIYTIALGSGADTGTLASMAFLTGGKFYQATNGTGLLDIYTRIFGELRGGGLIDAVGSLLAGASSENRPTLIDQFTEEATFSVSSVMPGFQLQLTSPTGKVYAASNPADGVLLESTPQETHFRVTRPVPGNWTTTVVSPNTPGAIIPYNLITNSSNPVVSVSANPDQTTYAFPAPVRVQCAVTAGDPVTGASVTAEVTGPDGVLGSMVLYDDGSPIHGDTLAGDGTYAGFYTAFPKSGAYTFEVKVANVNGTAGILEHEQVAGKRPVKVVPPFNRNTTASVMVTGVPTVDLDWFRVDSLMVTKRGTFNLRATLNSPPDLFVPQVDNLTLTLDGVQVVVPASAFKPTRQPGVFNIFGTGISGSLQKSIGGSSRNVLILRGKIVTAGRSSFDDTTEAGLEFGKFKNSVSLHVTTSRTGIAYNSSKNYANTPILYVDGFNATVLSAQKLGDTLRLVASYEGKQSFNPARQLSTLTIGSQSIRIPRGALRPSSNPSKFMGTVRVGRARGMLAIDTARQVVTLTVVKANTGSTIQPTLAIGLELGTSFKDISQLTLRATVNKRKATTTYTF